MDEHYQEATPAETTRMVNLTRLLAERANLIDKLRTTERLIQNMDLARDELDAILCYFRNKDVVGDV